MGSTQCRWFVPDTIESRTGECHQHWQDLNKGRCKEWIITILMERPSYSDTMWSLMHLNTPVLRLISIRNSDCDYGVQLRSLGIRFSGFAGISSTLSMKVAICVLYWRLRRNETVWKLKGVGQGTGVSSAHLTLGHDSQLIECMAERNQVNANQYVKQQCIPAMFDGYWMCMGITLSKILYRRSWTSMVRQVSGDI